MRWGAFLSYVFIACYTPGPNIILAMDTARRYGLKNALPLISGMCAGLFVVMSANAIMNIFISETAPQIMPLIGYAGAAYLVWLAVSAALPRHAEGEQVSHEKVPRMADGFIMQFLNPKVIMFGFTSMSLFIAPWTDSKYIFFICGVFLVINCTAALMLWAVFGQLLQARLSGYSRTIDLIMAGLLLFCAFTVFNYSHFFKIA